MRKKSKPDLKVPLSAWHIHDTSTGSHFFSLVLYAEPQADFPAQILVS